MAQFGLKNYLVDFGHLITINFHWMFLLSLLFRFPGKHFPFLESSFELLS